MYVQEHGNVLSYCVYQKKQSLVKTQQLAIPVHICNTDLLHDVRQSSLLNKLALTFKP